MWHKKKKEMRLTSFADIFPRLLWKSSISQPHASTSPSRELSSDSDPGVEAMPEPAGKIHTIHQLNNLINFRPCQETSRVGLSVSAEKETKDEQKR